MIAGLLAGIIIATVAGAYAKTTFKKMVKGQPATAADVNQAHQDLATAIDTLETEIAALKGAKACPAGYARDTSAAGITLCKRGSDEMIKVGDFWVDRYEMSVADATTYAGGKCSGKGLLYGTASDNYPANYPDSGDWTTPLYACSTKGVLPSRYMTWFQAQQACVLAGKHLCTNSEWQAAASGTPAASTSCNISDPTGTQAATTGKYPLCVSNHGAVDMIGNAMEWVAWWGQTNMGWMTKHGEHATPWPSTYGDGKDKTLGMNGAASDLVTGGPAKGMPAAAIRGGSWNQGTTAGAFFWDSTRAPSMMWGFIGARCCRR